MCGIIGAINHSGKYRHSMEKVMRDLMFADTLRGADATGIYAVSKELNVDWCKATQNGWAFQSRNTRAKNILKGAEEHVFQMVHNRAATMGDSDNADYAHPVVIDGKIGLVHNGTLNSWPGRKYGKAIRSPKDDHDSTAIAHHISNKGVQSFVDECMGAYSLVWHDVKEGTFNFLRNEERPMAMVKTDDVLFFGSELGMLLWILQRHSFKPLEYFHTKPNTLYTFETGEAVAKEVLITKKPTFSRSDRFQDEKDIYGHYPNYGHYPGQRGLHVPHQGRSDSSYSIINHDHDGALTPELIRSRAEAERLAQDSIERDEQIKQESKEKSQTSSTNPSAGAKVVHLRGEGKERGKVVDKYETYEVGAMTMFSLIGYGDVKEDHSTSQQFFMVNGDSRDFPNVEFRSRVNVSEKLNHKVMQESKNFWWGEITNIVKSMTGPVVIVWVKDIKESAVADPNWSTKEPKPKSILMNRTPAKESPKSILEGGGDKESCQGLRCGVVLPKKSLFSLTENWRDPMSRGPVSSQLRLCQSCVENYAENRKTVVHPKYADMNVDRTNITRMVQ